MPCTTSPALTAQQKAAQVSALQRLRALIGAGAVGVVIGRDGSIAFKGWTPEQREGVSDLCAYRALQNSPELRRAVIRAEAASGRRLDPRAIAAGLHSHDGGATWSRH